MKKAATSTWELCLCHAMAGWLLLYQKRGNLGCSSSISWSLISVLIFLCQEKNSLHPNPCTPPTLPVLLSSLWLLILLWQSLFCGASAHAASAPTPACLLAGGAQGLSGVNEFSVPLRPYVQKRVNLYPSFLKENTTLRTSLLQNL